jgi:hypothetical protein
VWSLFALCIIFAHFTETYCYHQGYLETSKTSKILVEALNILSRFTQIFLFGYKFVAYLVVWSEFRFKFTALVTCRKLREHYRRLPLDLYGNPDMINIAGEGDFLLEAMNIEENEKKKKAEAEADRKKSPMAVQIAADSSTADAAELADAETGQFSTQVNSVAD